MKGKKGFQKGKDNYSFSNKPWNYGKSPSEYTLEKQRQSHIGYIMPEEQKKKISMALKGKKKPVRSEEHCKKISESKKREKSSFWVDGRSYDNNKYPEDWRESLRNSIRERDLYVCQLCGIHQDELDFGQIKKLDIHHIDYNKDNLNPNNLISLCRSCHVKTNFNREQWYKYFEVDKNE